MSPPAARIICGSVGGRARGRKLRGGPLFSRVFIDASHRGQLCPAVRAICPILRYERTQRQNGGRPTPGPGKDLALLVEVRFVSQLTVLVVARRWKSAICAELPLSAGVQAKEDLLVIIGFCKRPGCCSSRFTSSFQAEAGKHRAIPLENAAEVALGRLPAVELVRTTGSLPVHSLGHREVIFELVIDSLEVGEVSCDRDVVHVRDELRARHGTKEHGKVGVCESKSGSWRRRLCLSRPSHTWSVCHMVKGDSGASITPAPRSIASKNDDVAPSRASAEPPLRAMPGDAPENLGPLSQPILAISVETEAGPVVRSEQAQESRHTSPGKWCVRAHGDTMREGPGGAVPIMQLVLVGRAVPRLCEHRQSSNFVALCFNTHWAHDELRRWEVSSSTLESAGVLEALPSFRWGFGAHRAVCIHKSHGERVRAAKIRNPTDTMKYSFDTVTLHKVLRDYPGQRYVEKFIAHGRQAEHWKYRLDSPGFLAFERVPGIQVPATVCSSLLNGAICQAGEELKFGEIFGARCDVEEMLEQECKAIQTHRPRIAGVVAQVHGPISHDPAICSGARRTHAVRRPHMRLAAQREFECHTATQRRAEALLCGFVVAARCRICSSADTSRLLNGLNR
eukprot:1967539-Prymnesium_polylepis.1